jgi:hypothetical protein
VTFIEFFSSFLDDGLEKRLEIRPPSQNLPQDFLPLSDGDIGIGFGPLEQFEDLVIGNPF